MFPYKHNFVLNPQISDALHVRYDLDVDVDRWPWLALPPDHPALIGKYSFFVGIGCGLDLLQLSPETASALTEVHWRNLPDCLTSELPHTAQAHIAQEDETFQFGCELRDTQNNVIQTLEAWGVIFQHRDYGSWRDKIKQAIERTRPQDFNFAAPESAGVATAGECFVSPLHEGRQGLSCYALVDKHAGFVPNHPWHTGTGDHVNASQLLDLTNQASHLVAHAQGWASPADRLQCLGGEARFKKYVELGSPCQITLTGWKPVATGRTLRFSIQQNAKTCAEVVLTLSIPT